MLQRVTWRLRTSVSNQRVGFRKDRQVVHYCQRFVGVRYCFVYAIGVTVGADGTALVADSTTSSGLSYGVQLESRFDQANLTANTTLATSVVNTSNYIAFAQTTANILATLPNPTVGVAKHRTITLCNEGTQTLGITFASGTGFFLNPSNVMDITWNGTAWVAANAQLAVGTDYAQAVIPNGTTALLLAARFRCLRQLET